MSSVLRQQNRSEGIYRYNVGNVNSKSKNFFFLLAFFLHHLNPYNSIKTITVYFSRIIPKQITENINIHWYLNWYRNCLDTFPSDGRKWIRKGREKLRKFDSFTRLSFVWRPLIINLKRFHTTWWKIKKMQRWVKSKYKASNVDAKKITWI